MPASRSADVETSYTKKVTDALEAADDFMSLKALAEATGLNLKALRPTLWWLRKIKAVDSLESGGTLWWFLTPDTDSRSKVINAHRKEDEPRKVRAGSLLKPRVTSAVRVKF